MNDQRLKRALKKAWQRNEDERWIYGLMGKIKGGVAVFDVEGRANYVYVRIRNQNGAQTSPPARNDPGVAHSENLPVRMRMEGTTLVIDSEVRREDLATTPVPPGSGVPVHIHDTRYFTEAEHISVSAGAADAGKPIKLDAAGLIDDSMLPSTVLTDTDDLPEGVVNLYASAANIAARIDAATVSSTMTTTDRIAAVISGTLRYFTYQTIRDAIKTYYDSVVATLTNKSISGATNTLSAIPNAALTNSSVTIGSTAVALGATAATVAGLTLTTPTIADYTNAQHDHGDADDGGALAAAAIANDAVTFAKMQNIVTDSLIGRDTAGTGDPENILLNATLSMDGAGNLQRAALTGDVTASAGSNATAIGANKVLTAMILDAQITLAKMANLAADTIIGRANGAGTGVPQALTATQVIAILQTGLDARYAELAGAAFTGLVSVTNATFPPLKAIRTTATTNAIRTAMSVLSTSTGAATDGFGTGISFEINDTSTSTQNIIVDFDAVRDGADDSGAFVIRTALAGVLSEWFRVTSAGVGFFGGLTAGGASVLGVKAGTSTNDAAVGGVLYTTATAVGNVGTGEDVLVTYSIPANTLSANNMSIELHAYGTSVNNANSKTVRVKFGATTLATLSLTTSAVEFWDYDVVIYRTGAATQKWRVVQHRQISGGGSAINIFEGTAAETLSGAVTLQITGDATTTNDILMEATKIRWDDSNS